MTESQKLLADYVQTGSENAFRELVTRYLDLVYSAALRLVEGDTHRAQDVAQTVFVDLARTARTLSRDVMLGGWLHRHTCFVAANTLRGERRRQSRERQAAEMNALRDHSETDLTLIAPILDEAINQLGEEDRTAVLLRFFEQRDFRSVGEALGSNEDAARMRVARALEKLHSLLKQRGVTASAAAFGVAISANAVQAAPAGLAVAISTAAALAGTTVATTATATITKAIAMTTLQKAIVGATLAFAVGTGIYQARQASTLRSEIEALRQQRESSVNRIQQLQRERDDAANRLALLRAENTALNDDELPRLRDELAQFKANTETNAVQLAAKSWLERVAELKQRMEQTPNAKIPELQFVTEQDWLNAARGELKTDVDFRRAMSAIRNAGESKVASIIRKAVNGYQRNNNRQFPTDLSQLQPYFDSPIDDAILQRWGIVTQKDAGFLFVGGNSNMAVTQKAPVDDLFDMRMVIGLDGGVGSTDFLSSMTREVMAPVYEAYRTAHNGESPDHIPDLEPYATTPEQRAALEKLILRQSALK